MLTNIYELVGWQEVVAVELMRHVAVDVGKNLDLACAEENLPSEESNVMWIREGREDGQIVRLRVEPNGMLKLLNVSVDDAGNYSCTWDDDRDAMKIKINVTVRSTLYSAVLMYKTICNRATDSSISGFIYSRKILKKEHQ